MLNFQKKQFLLIVVASMTLFILNNIILGAIIPRMPGGSAFGITTMFFITFLNLLLKKYGCLPFVYLIYGLFGILSHLLASDWPYLLAILLIVTSAALFDWFLFKQNYCFGAYIIAYPFFVAITQVMNFGLSYFMNGGNPLPDIKIITIALTLLSGYSGIILAYLCFRIYGNSKLIKIFGNVSNKTELP